MKGVTISPVDVQERANFDIRVGDTVRVWQKITENTAKGEKTRLQAFEGLVLARKHGKEAGGTFTVRKVASGVGVEKIFPLYSPMIDKIEIVKRAKVRRSKLYFLRDKVAREIKRALRRTSMMGVATKGSAELEEERKRAEAEQQAIDEAQAKLEAEEAAKKEAEEKAAAEAEEQKTEEAATEEAPAEEEKKEDATEDVAEEATEEEVSTEEADDLTKIEGIGPKIKEVLTAGGIATFAQLAESKDEDVQEMIKDVKGNHQAGTWNEQAALARDGKWDELKELQDKLDGGVEKE